MFPHLISPDLVDEVPVNPIMHGDRHTTLAPEGLGCAVRGAGMSASPVVESRPAVETERMKRFTALCVSAWRRHLLEQEAKQQEAARG